MMVLVLVEKPVHAGAEFLYGGERPDFMMVLVLVQKTVHDGAEFLYVGAMVPEGSTTPGTQLIATIMSPKSLSDCPWEWTPMVTS